MDMGTSLLEAEVNRLPSWFKQKIPNMEKIRAMKSLFRQTGLHTVCESAHCPNIGECWEKGTATFMILGDICTRACRFCAVESGRPLPVDHHEPRHVALTVKKLNLRYVVITSVARDDLPDEGANQFAQTVLAIKDLLPEVKVELLIPDLSCRLENLKMITDSHPEVISHNIETVSRLSKKIRPQADYARSLQVLKAVKNLNSAIFVKSSFMVGLGETYSEIVSLMGDLISVGCDLLTIGQYLAPSSSRRHMSVSHFVTPQEFESYRCLGLKLGFKYVLSGPLVRSSYIAEEGYKECIGEHAP